MSAFGAFGNTSQQSANPLFGQSNAPKPNPLFGLSQPATFAQNIQQQPQQQPQQQQQQQAPSNFFATPPAGASTAPSNFFATPPAGASTTASNFFATPPAGAPKTTSNFFATPPAGGSTTTSNFFATPPAAGGSSSIGPLFGGTQSQNQPQRTGQTGQQQGAFGLFGSSTNTNVGQSTGFGSSTNPLLPQSAQPFNAFGATTGGSLFGRQPSQLPQQQQQPAFGVSQAPAAAPPFTKSTKFNDLPDNAKKVFEQLDTHIQGRIQISKDLKQRKLGEEALKGQEVVRSVHRDLMSAITTLHSDVHHTRDLKARVDQTAQDTIIATRIIDGFRNPQQHGQHLKNHANFPLEFFNRVTEQMKERLRWYKATIEQIERKLTSVAAQSQYTPQAISSTLEAQHATFMALASKAAALDAELQKIKTLYTQLWRARTGSMRDPFNELDRGSGGEFGLEGISAT